ncbi:MAG: deoxyguanosinetriphosphate triphosphohydrolase [Pseudomonadota bacterium]
MSAHTSAPYATSTEHSRGRRFDEPPPRLRSEFQRDRDRIIHSVAFRRLVYKTQVFVNHEGDLYRTRLTHSLEVAQIGRSVARTLSLNEDLTEAICLAHDLGHTPFGHAGQDALNDCMRPFGGFEHNLQSLRVVDTLEQRYALFDGLNLCYETREGVLKHCAPDVARTLGELGQRFLTGHQPSLEAQLANIADEIAYNNHDVDDGIRAGLLDVDTLAQEVDLVGRFVREVRAEHAELSDRRMIYEVIRRMIGALVNDLVDTSRERLADANPRSLEDVRALKIPLISFSDTMRPRVLTLKQYLMANLYQHPRVREMTDQAQRVIRRLFEHYRDAAYADITGGVPPNLPVTRIRQTPAPEDREALAARAVADYVAGMTDRFALAEYDALLAAEQARRQR